MWIGMLCDADVLRGLEVCRFDGTIVPDLVRSQECRAQHLSLAPISRSSSSIYQLPGPISLTSRYHKVLSSLALRMRCSKVILKGAVS